MATSDKAFTKSLAIMKTESRAAVARTTLAAKKRLVALEKGAAAGLRNATKATGALAKKHQLATAGVLVATGVLMGVAAQRALRHKPTVGETVMDALSGGAARASRRAGVTAQRGFDRISARARQIMK